MLHCINKSPFASDSLATCLRFAQDQDPILLIQDGVYAAQTGTKFAALVQSALAKTPVFALESDLLARGVTTTLEGVRVIDYDGFVGLVEKHQVNSWL